jgi:TolA-binding protein
VVTERFEVELDDAALTVDPSSVRVRRGAARIVDRAHRPLAHVTSGGSWRPSDAVRPARAAEPPTASGAPAIDRLGVARAQLAAQDYAGAERSANDLLAAAPGRGDEAEARILLAEVAQAQGALELAVTRYLAVATQLSDLPAAESALYAAARIELRRTRAAAARALLTRYLDRYPRGRYAVDARRELAALP